MTLSKYHKKAFHNSIGGLLKKVLSKPKEATLASALTSIFPTWLVDRKDFQKTLGDRKDLSRVDISEIFNKYSAMRTNDDREKLFEYMKNLGVVNHYSDDIIREFLVK